MAADPYNNLASSAVSFLLTYRPAGLHVGLRCVHATAAAWTPSVPVPRFAHVDFPQTTPELPRMSSRPTRPIG